MGKRKPRILLYSHDTYGLGHLRRNLAIAERVASDIKGAYQLLLTGSMVAGAYKLPPRFDMVKLPALSKRSSGAYKARTLPLTLNNTISWREQIILQSALNFDPDIVLVDKAPAGVQGEMLPTLRHLKTWSPKTKLIFGMRDIDDAPAKTRQQWRDSGAYRLFDDVYDAVLLYGEREVFDPITAYGLSARAAGKVVETGYLGRKTPTHDTSWVRHKLNSGDKPLVIVTVGGGGDGYAIVRTFLDMLLAWEDAPFHAVVVTGPLMARQKQATMTAIANHPALTLIDFTPDLFDYMVEADVVVSMAGYNTTVELLSLGKRAILIPRQRVRAEQQMRASRLAERGIVQQLPLEALTMDSLRAAICHAFARPEPTIDLNLNGLATVSAELATLLKKSTLPQKVLL